MDLGHQHQSFSNLCGTPEPIIAAPTIQAQLMVVCISQYRQAVDELSRMVAVDRGIKVL